MRARSCLLATGQELPVEADISESEAQRRSAGAFATRPEHSVLGCIYSTNALFESAYRAARRHCHDERTRCGRDAMAH